MTTKKRTAAPCIEQILAIGLIWGHLNARQMGEAHQLARGCAALWPDDQRFALMLAYAAVELAEPMDDITIRAVQNSSHEAWTKLIWRRAYTPDDADDTDNLNNLNLGSGHE